jgi:RNA polymerase sigma-70 factor (ECF subfamily)
MGDEEVRWRPPQASEALRICRLGTEEVFLCGKEVLFPCRTEERLAGSYLEACLSGDMEALLSLLSEDVTLCSDGGGKARAALKPIHGADRVARLLPGVLRNDSPESIHIARINGQPGIIGYLADGRAVGVRVIEASERRIGAIRFMLNPEKLRAVPPLGRVERKEVLE